MSGEVLILHIFNIHIYLWYHQRLVYGYGLPNGLPSVLMRCLVRCLVRFHGRETRPTRIRFLRRGTKALA
jgi:hypothetical protein